jgi:hypothetical protein
MTTFTYHAILLSLLDDDTKSLMPSPARRQPRRQSSGKAATRPRRTPATRRDTCDVS